MNIGQVQSWWSSISLCPDHFDRETEEFLDC